MIRTRLFLLLAASLGFPSLVGQTPVGIIISEQSRTGFMVQGAGARATGLGGAFIAVADDATAVSFNPAGLAQLLKPEVSFVGRASQHSMAYEDVAVTSTGGTQRLVSDSLLSTSRFDPLFISGTVPLRVNGKNLVLQLSAQRLIALGESDTRDLMEAETPEFPANRLTQSITQRGQIDLYSLAMAYEASQRILLGITLNVWRGSWSLDSRSSKLQSGSTSYVNFYQDNHLEGSNFNLGLIWRWPTWSLGLIYRTGFHADYTYSTHLDTFPAPANPRPNGTVNTGLHWPATLGLGWAYRPGDRWLLTCDVTHTAWSDARYLSNRPALNGLNFFDLDKGTSTPNAVNVRTGVERLFLMDSGSVIPLRFGGAREPQPVVDRLTGHQRIMNSLSLGTGFKRGPYTVDLGYRYAWSSRRTSQFLDVDQLLSRTGPTSIGTERVKEHRLDVSFIVQFERQPVERMLRYLFVGD
ncbi:MAG: UPF0164 family protein [Firmicutes bacterium]|nr:UPF0164 family protein [Bacillota bacterium]